MDNAIHDFNIHTADRENITDLNFLPEQSTLSKVLQRTFVGNSSMIVIRGPIFRLSQHLTADNKCYGGFECPSQMDELGDHAVICSFGKSQIFRHDLVTTCISSLLKRAGLNHKREARINNNSIERPGDIMLKWFDNDLERTFFDIGITQKNVSNQVVGKLRAVDEYFEGSFVNSNASYIPLTAEAAGAWHQKAVKVFCKIAEVLDHKEGRDLQQAKDIVFGAISIALQKGNALAFCTHCQ
ncbi:hypothetical protein RFI_20706 [Reticulomyxa filosa]|uniref:Uncharacterized protein n=1 Tax=Reticulomyxa filosa TaxID=46433 RepID=X6MRI7_RETFI|nr:hypothetical protein RFI_20706 [Reticulomyxa filosa]|eukprot:ETO16633.1 hypothetical protein RFI_20706 [Reticulomyxa filosa]